jgi:NADPH2:quinone reductase
MGLLLLQLVRHGGAGRIAVVDRIADKLPLARRLGADETAGDVAALEGADGPGGFDVAIDATGAPPAIEAAFGALRRGGRLLVFGVAPSEATVSLSPFRIYNDEITVLGSMAVLNSFGPALDVMRAGAIDTEAMLTHTFALDGFADALRTVREGGGIKVQVLPGERA